jgi:hypothetical protein
MSAAKMADPPLGDPAWEDTPFLYAANMHNSTEAWTDTEYQTAYLESDFVDSVDIPEDINIDPLDDTSQALKLIAEAARVNRLTRVPAERTIASFGGMARLAERMIEPLTREAEEIKKDLVLEEQAVKEIDRLIRSIENGTL